MHDRIETVTDAMDPARAAALEIALGHAPTAEQGRPLAPFFHQLYFWQPQPPEALGPDGHPRVGGLIPDFGLPRRMWASGRLVWHRPLLAGVRAERRTRIESTMQKEGRSGPLAFVTLRHDIHQRGSLAMTEWQDLVYRAAADAKAPASTPPMAPEDADHERPFAPDTTLLFRYSALTMNGHRIHYDADYARRNEGYDGLVVHGPLLAQSLMLMAQAALGPLARFSYRATAPLICGTSARLCHKDRDFWVASDAGTLHMHATATPG